MQIIKVLRSFPNLLAWSGLSAALCAAAPPYGYETITIFQSQEVNRFAEINDCGEIVFTNQPDTNVEIRTLFRYDCGTLQSVAGPGAVGYVRINNAGDMAWFKGEYPEEQVVLLPHAGNEQVLGPGLDAALNDLTHIAWFEFTEDGCAAAAAEVYFFDGNGIELLLDDGLSNQAVRINNSDLIVWSSANYCDLPTFTTSVLMTSPWRAIEVLATGATKPQLPDVNDLGQVVWRDTEGVHVWENGEEELVIPGGYNPRINNFEDIFSLKFNDAAGTWETYLRSNGVDYQIGAQPLYWHTDGAINDYGECAWEWSIKPQFKTWGINYLRRIRTGDAPVDFKFDGDIDLADFAAFQNCTTGPGDFDRLCDCRFLDIDHDRDVDEADYMLFAPVMGGPGK